MTQPAERALARAAEGATPEGTKLSGKRMLAKDLWRVFADSFAFKNRAIIGKTPTVQGLPARSLRFQDRGVIRKRIMSLYSGRLPMHDCAPQGLFSEGSADHLGGFPAVSIKAPIGGTLP